MTADDLNAALGQEPKQRRRSLPVTLSQLIAGALSLFLALFALWAVFVNNPFGGEPMVVVPADLHPTATTKTAAAQQSGTPATGASRIERYDGPAVKQVPPSQDAAASAPQPAAKTNTVTIIDGKTGQQQQVTIPAPLDEVAPTGGATANPKLAEITAYGALPKIAADGLRPDEAFAQPVKALPGKPDAPRIALVVDGLGVSANATAAAITKLPAAVTLGFMPYGADVAATVARARATGHEILLQVPMEPFDYPDNDPGPQALLTTLAPEQNIDRLHWLMTRLQGYVGLTNAMGARFTASEDALAPVLRETNKRGLIYVDDGSSPRSVAGQIAGANNMPFAKADVTLDAVPSPEEIDRALGRLEMAAREHGVAVGVSSALPVSIDHIAKWAKAAEGRGLLLVPITAVALKAKPS